MRRSLSLLLLFCLAGCAASPTISRQDGHLDFRLHLPEAGEVLFASSRNSYQPQPLHRDRQGRWITRIPAEREFHYFFLVDGKLYLPDCRYRQHDDFGTATCIHQP